MPEIQMGIYASGEIYPNYYKMAMRELWINHNKLVTSTDFYFESKRLAIFCDGKEFHEVEKDKKITLSLSDIGIKSLRFSGKDITENIENVLEIIENKLKE